MRRRSVLILTAAGLAAIGVGMAPWTLADDHATRQISKHVNALTGLGLDVRGPVTLAVLPAPRIKFEDVVLSTADGAPLVTARQLRGQLQLAPLLAGRFVLADAAIVDPVVRANAPRISGEHVWTGLLAQLASAYQRASGGAPHISRLTVIGGILSSASSNQPLAENVNATLAWTSPESTLALSGNLIYGVQAVEFSLSGLAPRAIASGGDTDLTARLTSDLLRVDMRGALTDGGRRFDGKIRFAAPSVARVNNWLDLRLPLTGAAAALSVDATCSLTTRGMALTSASVTVNDSALEGALSLRGAENGWALGGTLAADDLDLRSAPGLSHEMGAAMLSPGRWRAWDIDLRLSAGRIRLPANITARDVAASVLLRNGRLEAVLGAAEALGGRLKGRMAIAPGSVDGVEIRAQATADGVSASELSTLATGAGRLAGPASGAFTLETRGSTASELRKRLEGRGHVQMGEGELSGVSFADLLQLANRPGAPLKLRGKTKFSSLRVGWSLAGDRIAIDDASLQGAVASVRLNGAVMTDGALALEGNVTPGGSASQPAPFRLTGTWSAPALAPPSSTSEPDRAP